MAALFPPFHPYNSPPSSSSSSPLSVEQIVVKNTKSRCLDYQDSTLFILAATTAAVSYAILRSITPREEGAIDLVDGIVLLLTLYIFLSLSGRESQNPQPAILSDPRKLAKKNYRKALKERAVIVNSGAVDQAIGKLARHTLVEDLTRPSKRQRKQAARASKKNTKKDKKPHALHRAASSGAGLLAKRIKLKKVGAGGQGQVRRVGDLVIKSMEPTSLDSAERSEYSFFSEEEWSSFATGIHAGLKIPHILAPLGVVTEINDKKGKFTHHVIMPYLDAPNLLSGQKQLQQMKPQELKQFMAWFLLIVDQLHRHDVIHRDLKPHNTLLHKLKDPSANAPYFPVILDFDLSLLLPGNDTFRPEIRDAKCGTPPFMAPEIEEIGGSYGLAVDWYAAGKTLQGIYNLWGLPSETSQEKIEQTFWAAIEVEPYVKFIDAEKHFDEGAREQFVDLLQDLLMKDPRLRTTTIQMLQGHPFFKEVSWELPPLHLFPSSETPDLK